MRKSNTRNEFGDIDPVLDVPVSSFWAEEGSLVWSSQGGSGQQGDRGQGGDTQRIPMDGE